MSNTVYNFSIQTNFPNHKVAADTLTQEIQQSSIAPGLAYIQTLGDNCSIYFKASLSSEEQTILSEIVSVHSGQAIITENKIILDQPKTTTGLLRVVSEKTDSAKKNFFSHDWTDPTTWYSTSQRIVDEIATDSGDHRRYNVINQNMIDLYHGKIWGEDFVVDSDGYDYRVHVTVNDVEKEEIDPHSLYGDFYVNYSDGYITFNSPLNNTDVVKITYHKMVNSEFTVSADPGKTLLLVAAEAQFSKDVNITDSIVFQPYGLVDAFAPELVPNAFPSGTSIPLGNPVIYKTIKDYNTEAIKSYPAYPPMGGNGWRGLDQEVIIFFWDYVACTKLVGNAGMKVVLKLEHDMPFQGSYATCSFYCIVD